MTEEVHKAAVLAFTAGEFDVAGLMQRAVTGKNGRDFEYIALRTVAARERAVSAIQTAQSHGWRRQLASEPDSRRLRPPRQARKTDAAVQDVQAPDARIVA